MISLTVYLFWLPSSSDNETIAIDFCEQSVDDTSDVITT